MGSGELPPGEFPTEKFPLWKITPRGKLTPRENFSLEITLPPWKTAIHLISKLLYPKPSTGYAHY